EVLAAFASCDPRAKVETESYLSVFQFGADFHANLKSNGDSTAGFEGDCWAPWLYFDVDDLKDPQRAMDSARRLTSEMLDRYRALDPEHLLIFFSGSKGYHVGLPTSLWGPAPSPDFHRVARYFARSRAGNQGVTIDESVYKKVQPFRAPNSWHPKTGLHK